MPDTLYANKTSISLKQINSKSSKGGVQFTFKLKLIHMRLNLKQSKITTKEFGFPQRRQCKDQPLRANATAIPTRLAAVAAMPIPITPSAI